MANIFRSKEVFKKLRKEVHDGNTIVPVYGLYVSGEYKPPYYVGNGVHLTSIGGKPARVVNFTTRDYELYPDDHALNLLDIDMDTGCPDVISFTKKDQSVDDHVLNLLDIDMDTTLDILSYTQDRVSSDDHVLNFLDIDMDIGISWVEKHHQKRHTTPEPQLRITNIQTKKAEVSNYQP